MAKNAQEKKKPTKCPKCGDSKIVPIVFGYPSPETNEEVRRGEIALGGCCCYGDERDNKWVCRKCRHEFGGVNRRRGRNEQ